MPTFVDVEAHISFSGERFGSGDGEREAWKQKQMNYEPLPASDLVACPFCGGVPELHRWTNLHQIGEWSRVECVCGIRTSALGAVTETIRRWNTRSQANAQSQATKPAPDGSR